MSGSGGIGENQGRARRILAASKSGFLPCSRRVRMAGLRPILGDIGLLVVADAQVVQMDGVGGLLVVSVHLEVFRHAVPSHRGEGRIGGIDCTGDAVESDCLIQQTVRGSPLKLNCKVVPGMVERVAGSLGGDPSAIDVVPNPPDLAVDHLALSAKHEAEVVEELTYVEFQIFGELQVTAVEVDIE